jgi:hypothetical protein
MSVASPVKVSSTETVAASSPKKHKLLPAELVEERRKERDEARVQFESRRSPGKLLLRGREGGGGG